MTSAGAACIPRSQRVLLLLVVRGRRPEPRPVLGAAVSTTKSQPWLNPALGARQALSSTVAQRRRPAPGARSRIDGPCGGDGRPPRTPWRDAASPPAGWNHGAHAPRPPARGTAPGSRGVDPSQWEADVVLRDGSRRARPSDPARRRRRAAVLPLRAVGGVDLPAVLRADPRAQRPRRPPVHPRRQRRPGRARRDRPRRHHRHRPLGPHRPPRRPRSPSTSPTTTRARASARSCSSTSRPSPRSSASSGSPPRSSRRTAGCSTSSRRRGMRSTTTSRTASSR